MPATSSSVSDLAAAYSADTPGLAWCVDPLWSGICGTFLAACKPCLQTKSAPCANSLTDFFFLCVWPLTAFTGFYLSARAVAALPLSIQSLVLDEWRSPDTRWTTDEDSDNLSHLTAVTHLSTGALRRPRRYWPLVYPPNLVRLDDSFVPVSSLQPLTALQHLGGWIGHRQALRLCSTLTALTHLCLHISCRHRERESVISAAQEVGCTVEPVIDELVAAGLHGAVRSVWLDNRGGQWRGMETGVLDARLAQQLCRLPNLSTLKVHVHVTAEGIAELRRSGLSELQLFRSYVSKQEVLQLPAALANVPSLRRLQVPQQLTTLRAKARTAFFEQLVEQCTQIVQLQLWPRTCVHQPCINAGIESVLRRAGHLQEAGCVSWSASWAGRDEFDSDNEEFV